LAGFAVGGVLGEVRRGTADFAEGADERQEVGEVWQGLRRTVPLGEVGQRSTDWRISGLMDFGRDLPGEVCKGVMSGLGTDKILAMKDGREWRCIPFV
jgi:hypothetical protein